MPFFSERTEAPTTRRREEARRRGQLPKSAELTAVAVMIAGFALANGMRTSTMTLMSDNLSNFITAAVAPHREQFLASLGARSMSMLATLLLPALLMAALTVVAVNVAQAGLVFTAKPITPDFSRISPALGVQRMFSSVAGTEFLKSLIKVFVVGWVVYSVLRREWWNVLMTAHSGLGDGLNVALNIGHLMVSRLLLALALLALLDYALQRRRVESQLKLTRQELKEENRQSEGDPLLKSRLRRRQRQIAMQRIMQQVPNADVVIVNPTHFAVAIRYDAKTMPAPKVIAKGLDFMAQRIIATAQQHNIPIVHNPPLAQALYRAVEMGRVIPSQFYQAVAEVLAYVYRLTGHAREFAR